MGSYRRYRNLFAKRNFENHWQKKEHLQTFYWRSNFIHLFFIFLFYFITFFIFFIFYFFLLFLNFNFFNFYFFDFSMLHLKKSKTLTTKSISLLNHLFTVTVWKEVSSQLSYQTKKSSCRTARKMESKVTILQLFVKTKKSANWSSIPSLNTERKLVWKLLNKSRRSIFLPPFSVLTMRSSLPPLNSRDLKLIGHTNNKLMTCWKISTNYRFLPFEFQKKKNKKI